jgi:uncharacterized protein (DUF1697 family)
MTELRRYFEEIGCSRVETFIASGNVVFESREKNLQRIETAISRKLRAELGYDVATFVRTLDDLADVAAQEPFDAVSVSAAPTYCVAFIGATPNRDVMSRLKNLEAGLHQFHVYGPHIYWLSTLKQSDREFAKVAFERVVGQTATLRGMNTIRRMALRYASTPAGAA